MEKNKSVVIKNENLKQVILFAAFSAAAGVTQLLSRIVLDLVFKNLDQAIQIWPFEKQALGSFLAFLISNIIAKVISYVTNRKTTFKANNDPVSSAVIYLVMVVVLIIAETIIGTPLQNAIYRILGGTFSGAELSTATVDVPVLYQICGVASQALYGLADGLIVFFMDKYVIMRNEDRRP